MDSHASTSYTTDYSYSTEATALPSTPHPLLPSLNHLLSTLHIPISLSSLALATPSLLLTILEALLERRVPLVELPSSVRNSWDKADRKQTVETLLRWMSRELGNAWSEDVSVVDVVKGRESALEQVVRGLLRIEELVAGRREQETTRSDITSITTTSSTSSRRTATPTRVPLRQVLARSASPAPPVPATPTRSTLRLLNALSPPPSPSRRPPLLVKPLVWDLPKTTRPQAEVLRPVPRWGRAEMVEREVAASVGESAATPSGEDTEVEQKAEESECECACETAGEGNEGGAECTCGEEGEWEREAEPTPVPTQVQAQQRHRRKKKRPTPAPTRPYGDSSASDDPQRHGRSVSIPRAHAFDQPRHPNPASRPRGHKKSASTSSLPILHTHSGYLSLVGESEIEAFERRRHSRPSHTTSTFLDAPPPPPPLRTHAAVLVEESPSPYTLMLLSQRTRLEEKLAKLKLEKGERRKREDQERTEVVRRRVERVGEDWWREGKASESEEV